MTDYTKKYGISQAGLHSLCNDNRLAIEDSKRDSTGGSEQCGCFHCCRIFPADTINEWIGRADRAVCPLCGIDSVLPDSLVELTDALLHAMFDTWFTKGTDSKGQPVEINYTAPGNQT